MMGSVCAEQQQHKFHHSHQLFNNLTKKSLRDVDIPPRKLLGRRSAAAAAAGDVYADSPRAEDAVFSKFLPYNNADADDDDDPYSSDQFRIYEFKVRKCNRSRSHDWTDCPFAHPGEKARRRDPRRYRYSGTVCSEFRKGHCGKGDNCEFSHGVFECWLHPSRYRTEACKDGKNCKRKVCFFAHSTRQLRIVPDTSSPSSPPPAAAAVMDHSPAAEKNMYRNPNVNCCLFCHSVTTTTASPTSTLMMGMSHHLSPPASPPISPAYSPEFSPYGFLPEFGGGGGGGLSYKDAILNELMASVEAMNMNEAAQAAAAAAKRNLPWLDVNFSAEEHQPQFVLSPSTPTTLAGRGHSKFVSGDSKFYRGDISSRNLMENNRYNNSNNEGNMVGPDLGWVNDLLT
ncbi:hypothetical protein ACP275_13G035500 [Erythranthe tilingii]